MRIWTKFVDEYFCPALSYLAWSWMIAGMVKDLSAEEFEAKLARIPLKEQQDKWRITAREGYPKERLDEWRRQVLTSIGRLETALAKGGPWLLGEQFTLADIACFSMAQPMPSGYADVMNQRDTPHLMAWHGRMMQREGVQAALAMPNRYRDEMLATQSKEPSHA